MTAIPLRPGLIALLDACKDEPDDDAPRLVLADWLEEFGDESDRARAEFVRLQLEHDGEDELSPRERELLREHGPSWLWPIIDAFDFPVGSGSVRHDRGLLHVEIPIHRLADAQEQGQLAGREQWAWVQALTLTDLDATLMRQLRGSPLLAGVTGLRLSGRCNSRSFSALLDWPLTRLLVLDLSDGSLAFDALGPIAGWAPVVSRLRVLRVSGAAATDRGLLAMQDLQQPGALRELTATHSRITARGAAALGASWVGRSLRRLDLAYSPLGADGVRALLAGERLSLTHLRLDGTQATDDGARAIAECPHLTGLRCLHLADNRISSRGAFALLDSRMLADVRSLNLGYNLIGPRLPEVLAARGRRRLALRSLLLFDNALGSKGAGALADCAALSGLRELDLCGNDVGDEGCERLAATGTLTHLTHLDLRDNGITDRGARALAASPALAGLRRLQLTGNDVGHEALALLVRRFGEGVVEPPFPETAATEGA